MLAALFAVAAVACLGAALRPVRLQVSSSVARLSTMTSREVAQAQERERPLWERLLRPLMRAVAHRVPVRLAGLSEDDLRRAGFDPARLRVEDVIALKVLGGLGGAALVLAVSFAVPAALFLLPALSFGAFVAPSVVVTRRRLARRRQLQNELPDFVGLLKAFVGTGIPLEQALHLISEQLTRGGGRNLLAVEVRKALSEYGLGLSIDAALEHMARRTGVEELDLLAAALAQGKRQGAGMERILRDQEQVVRMQQRNRAVAEAAKVSTRLVGVLVLVYLPEFMLLIMIPLFYGIFLRAFS